MESESNTQKLRALTKRERKTTGKRKDALKDAAKGEDSKEKAPSRSLPGATYLKKLTSSTAINVMAFGVACFAIYKYGDKMAEYIEAQVPSEKGILEAIKQ